MTRQEEIITTTKEFYPIPDTECLAKDAFLVGANWADNHPHKLSKEEIVDRLCKIHNISDEEHLAEEMAGWGLCNLESLIDEIQNFY